MTSLFDKIKANSKITSEKGMKLSTFANSPFATSSTLLDNTAKTPLPILNIAYSGDLNGGVHENKLITIAGESKHYKSNLALLSVKGYLDKYPESLCIFFDSEFGITNKYMELTGIDPERVIHIPITNIEELKFEIISQLENLTKEDKVIFLIDSIGNLASKKEIDDALDEKSVADMTRAKALKGLFRMVTPYLALKNKSVIAINHVYESQGLFSKKVVSGGCVYKGTKVLMANGDYKAIETIQVGEYVQTLNGNKEVSHTWTPETLLEGTPETIELTFDDGFIVKTSLNHKFLTKNRGWVKAIDLTCDDEFVMYAE